MSQQIKTAIVGAQGYTGLQLASLLKKHPHASLAGVYSRDSSWAISQELGTQFATVPTLATQQILESASQFDVIFFATPASVSLTEIPKLLASHPNLKIIDISGAFRLPTQLHNRHYPAHQHDKPCVEYGLVPWVSVKPETKLISNPGCYATASLMALLPLLKNELIEAQSIIIDAKSGISGAGRSAQQSLLFSEIANNFYPYKTGVHQHQPEIETHLEKLTGQKTSLLLNTQILPVKQGLCVSIYATVKTNNPKNIMKAYHDAYQDYALAQVQSLNESYQTSLLQLKSVIQTPNTHISFKIIDDKLFVNGMIDNLYKGAASQAIENLNNSFNLHTTTGLIEEACA